MLRRKFDSPIEEALAVALHNRLTSAVYAALSHAIRYHEDADLATELRRYWQDVGAWFVAEDLIRSARSDWPPEQWNFPRIFCVQPDTAQFLQRCTKREIVAPSNYGSTANPWTRESIRTPASKMHKFSGYVSYDLALTGDA